VNVKRRETDIQVERRMKSYAFIAQQEEAEEWVRLQHHSADSAAADRVWQELLVPTEDALDVSLPRGEYLAAFLPGERVAAAAFQTDR
jgi:RPC5 protein